MEEYFSQNNVIDVDFWETNLRKEDARTEIDIETQCDDQLSFFPVKCFPQTDRKDKLKFEAIDLESEKRKLLNFDFIARDKLSRSLKIKPLQNCSNSELNKLMLHYNNNSNS